MVKQWNGEGSRPGGVRFETFNHFLLSKKFDICESLSKNFDIFTKIVFRDAEIFFSSPDAGVELLRQIF